MVAADGQVVSASNSGSTPPKQSSDSGSTSVAPGKLDIKAEHDDSIQPPVYRLHLIADPAVRKELNLTADQVRKLHAIRVKFDSDEAESRKPFDEAIKNTEKLPPQERAKSARKLSNERSRWMVAKIKEARKQAEEVFTPEQLELLKEEMFRELAYSRLTDTPFSRRKGLDEFNFTKYQNDAVHLLRKEANDWFHQYHRAIGDKTLSILTPEQKALLREEALGPLGPNDSLEPLTVHIKEEKEPYQVYSLAPYPDFTQASVRKELGLSAAQEQQVRDILGESLNLAERFARDLEKLSPEERKKLRESSTNAMNLVWSANLSDSPEEPTKMTEARKKARVGFAEQPVMKPAIALRKQFEAVLTPQQLARYQDLAVRTFAAGALDGTLLPMIGASQQQQAEVMKFCRDLSAKGPPYFRDLGRRLMFILAPAQEEVLRAEFEKELIEGETLSSLPDEPAPATPLAPAKTGSGTLNAKSVPAAEAGKASDAAGSAANDWKALNNLGVYLWKQAQEQDLKAAAADAAGDPETAKACRQKSIALKNDAKAQWIQGIKVNPKAADVHSNLGYAYSEANDLDSAERHLTEAVRLKPISSRPHNNLGRVFLRRSQQLEAEARQAEAKGKTDPGEAAKARQFKDKAKAKLDAATEQFEKAVELDPALLEARLNLGAVYITLNNLDKAELQYQGILNSTDQERINYSQACLGLARVDIARKKSNEAIRHLQEAIELNPGNASAMQLLAKLLFERGDFELTPAQKEKQKAGNLRFDDFTPEQKEKIRRVMPGSGNSGRPRKTGTGASTLSDTWTAATPVAQPAPDAKDAASPAETGSTATTAPGGARPFARASGLFWPFQPHYPEEDGNRTRCRANEEAPRALRRLAAEIPRNFQRIPEVEGPAGMGEVRGDIPGETVRIHQADRGCPDLRAGAGVLEGKAARACLRSGGEPAGWKGVRCYPYPPTAGET